MTNTVFTYLSIGELLAGLEGSSVVSFERAEDKAGDEPGAEPSEKP